MIKRKAVDEIYPDMALFYSILTLPANLFNITNLLGIINHIKFSLNVSLFIYFHSNTLDS